MKRRPHESPDCNCAPCREWEMTQMMFDFHSRGSIPVEMILELLNMDLPEEGCVDHFDVNDPAFNDLLRKAIGDSARAIMDDELSLKLKAYVDRLPPEEQMITWNWRLSM